MYFLNHKFDVFKKWKAIIENDTSLKLKYLRSYNGGEYYNKKFEDY